MRLPTTTGTQNILLGAVTAKGKTEILNANTRPENRELCALLNLMGAKIKVANRVIEIEGVKKLGGAEYTVMSGWDEGVSYMLLCGMTGGEIRLVGEKLTEHMVFELKQLREIGIDVFEWGGDLYVIGHKEKMRFDLFTGPHPAINSDTQPLFAAMATQIKGRSSINDLRFEQRFKYVKEYRKLKAKIKSFGNSAVIEGVNKIKGGVVSAPDLRGGMGLLMLAMVADGDVQINNAGQIMRG